MTLVSTVLRKAADLVETHGWVRGTYYEPGTRRCCVLGAIGLALGACPGKTEDDTIAKVEWQIETRVGKACQATLAEAIRETEPEVVPTPFDSRIVEWNDKQQDKTAVISLLRLAARKSEGEGP